VIAAVTLGGLFVVGGLLVLPLYIARAIGLIGRAGNRRRAQT
jgi:hypothetical protein